ncbi:hypothetical protein AGMMS49982_15650 [Bacteroidia bacterium]|nr:hypothetical protein AGMMS49982_15650 [Bacteroidia bacterium]
MEKYGSMEKYGVLNEYGIIELTEVDKFLEDLENGDIIIDGRNKTKEDEEAFSAYFQARKAQCAAAVA